MPDCVLLGILVMSEILQKEFPCTRYHFFGMIGQSPSEEEGNGLPLYRGKGCAKKSSVLCSAHFKPEDYERRMTNLTGFGSMKAYLKEDEIGIVPNHLFTRCKRARRRRLF